MRLEERMVHMARKKKRMKLPNGFGSIKYLGGNRRNPYAVYPPVTEWTEKGPVTPKALGYKETWEDAYELLTIYNMEQQGKIKTNTGVFIDRTPTFAEVYNDFYKEKFESDKSKTFSKATHYAIKAAFKHCSPIHNKAVGQLKYEDLQSILNECPLRYATLELIVSFLHQMYAYMLKHELVEKDHSAFLYIPKPDDNESGEPFTEDELKILWENKGDEIIQMILIMCYSGYRIKAYTKMEINLKENYFKGGVKNKTSKDRIVPIHSAILPLVQKRATSNNLLGYTTHDFRIAMYSKLKDLGIDYTKSGKKHTPHDCRHTFSALCEKYKVNENDRRRMLGHSFGNDITNATYGHRTVEELREEIEKIKIPK